MYEGKRNSAAAEAAATRTVKSGPPPPLSPDEEWPRSERSTSRDSSRLAIDLFAKQFRMIAAAARGAILNLRGGS